MEELYKLKETLCNELEEYAKKSKMGAGDLEVVDKLTHTIKNLDHIIEKYDDNYSGRMYSGRDYRPDHRYSMARKRDSRGRYSSEYRDGYSGHDMVMELREMMEEAPDERTRMEFDKFIRKMEQM